MTLTRIAVAAGIAVLTAFVVVVVLVGPAGLGAVIVGVLAIAGLVAAGNLLYGRNSHYAAAQARLRGEDASEAAEAEEPHDRAITEAQARARASEWPGRETPTDQAGGPEPLR